jgi:hypothetical protein
MNRLECYRLANVTAKIAFTIYNVNMQQTISDQMFSSVTCSSAPPTSTHHQIQHSTYRLSYMRLPKTSNNYTFTLKTATAMCAETMVTRLA